MTFLEYHPLANLFPLIDGEAFDELVEDVRTNGVREPIILLDGRILDGRNRYRAGLEAGFFSASDEGGLPHPQYMFDHFPAVCPGVDPLAWVVSKNLRRRHLTDDQRRMVAARIANLKGRPSEKSLPNGQTSRVEAAELLSVDVRGVDRAKRVLTTGAEELQRAVDDRRVTVRMAADLASLPVEQQREVIALTDPKALRQAVRGIRANLRAAIGTDSASAAERGNNLYETPPEAMRALLSLMRFSMNVWEPACGRGAIARELEAAGYELELSDLVDYGTVTKHGECQRVQDFLETVEPHPDRPDIVTNPPYGTVLNAFVAHALRVHRPRRMALLLNLNFLCGFEDPDRNFAMDECPPATIWVFTRRLPMMHRDGWDGPEASSRMNTAWFVWELDEATGTYDAAGKRDMRVVRIDWKTFENSRPCGPVAIPAEAVPA